MFRNFKGIGIVILFFVMLVFPKAVFSGASEGLLLWFQIVLPTLFPFLLISSLLVGTGNISLISSVTGKFLSLLFRVSPCGSFAVITGFLCGYPMGAKTAADMVVSGQITKKEGQYLLSFCNNTSPVFIMNFLVWKTLKREELMMPSLLILIISPVIVSFFTRKIYLGKHARFESPSVSAGCEKNSWSFREIDACIMNSFETLVNVGGYIMLFSVLLTIGKLIRIPIVTCLLPLLEMTNGIVLINRMALPFAVKYPALLGLTSFGGFCSVAQTKCMVQDAGLPVLPYITEKLAAALTASILGVLYLHLS